MKYTAHEIELLKYPITIVRIALFLNNKHEEHINTMAFAINVLYYLYPRQRNLIIHKMLTKTSDIIIDSYGRSFTHDEILDLDAMLVAYNDAIDNSSKKQFVAAMDKAFLKNKEANNEAPIFTKAA